MARRIEVEIVSNERGFKLGKTQSSLQKLGKAAGVAGLALGAGLAVAAKLGFDELAQGQKVAAQTAAVIKSTGQAANVTAGHVEELSEALMKKSGVDDEVIASGQNMLLTFKKIRNEVGAGNDIFDQATKATLDLSVAMGTDMQSAAILVGKALNDPVAGLTSLTRKGVQFTKAQKEQIKALVESGQTMKAQKIILAELESQFGGSAEAAGKTLPGQLAIAKESFTNLAGELVANLLPALTRGSELLLRLARYLQENPAQAKAVVIGLGALTAALLAASAAQLALNLAVLANPYVAAAAAILALGVGVTVLVKKVAFFRRHWQLLLITLGLGPVIVATVVKAIIRHLDTIVGAFNRVKGAAVATFNVIRAAVGPLVAVLSARFRALQTIGVRAFGLLAAAVRSVIGPIQTLVGWVQTAWGWLKKITGKVWKVSIDFPSLPSLNPLDYLAAGTNNFRGGLAMVGERGPEIVNLPRGSQVIPNHRLGRGGGSSGGSGFPGGPVAIMTTREVAMWLQGVAADYGRQNGGRGLLA